MRYTLRKIEGGAGALRESDRGVRVSLTPWSDDTNFLKPNGQSRNLNIYF